MPRTITIKTTLVLLIATAAVAPLLIYGYVSVSSLRTGTRQSVIVGNRRVAARAAEQIQLYIDSNVKLLRSLGDDLRTTRLEPWQQDRVVKNHVIDFPEFREITLFDAAGKPLATSRIGAPQLTVPSTDQARGAARGVGDVYISPIIVDEDILPTVTVAIRLPSLEEARGAARGDAAADGVRERGAGQGGPREPSATRGAGVPATKIDALGGVQGSPPSNNGAAPSSPSWLVGELNLEEMWRMVDRIRVGREGFALVVARGGQLIAHGNPNEKPRVARGENLLEHPLVRALSGIPTPLPSPPAGEREASDRSSAPLEQEYRDAAGRTLLAVGAPLPALGWTVIVEQPADEAYSLAIRLEDQLLAATAIALLATMIVGYLWGRSLIRPIFALMRGTGALAEGRPDERVSIKGGREFRQLGAAFNHMADRLIELQANVVRQERQAMFGRVAAGLVHDLAHPIQNIGNSCHLMLRMFDDEAYRQTFRRTVDRELAAVKRVIGDLRDLARPKPLERVPLDVNRSVFEVVESMQPQAEAAGVALVADAAPEALVIEGDHMALGRVYRNLITNAIQATAPGGHVTVTTSARDQRVRVAVADTGCGIPAERLGAIFDDFVTTKRRGLGLGLAISKKIVEQLNGAIEVSSEVDKGTTFVLDFPRVSASSRQAAAMAG